MEVLTFEFDTTTNAELIVAAGKKLNVVGIHITSQETDCTELTRVRIVWWDGASVTDIYGSSNYGLQLQGNGGSWGLPITKSSLSQPYWIGASGDDLFIQPIGSDHIAGCVWYYLTDA